MKKIISIVLCALLVISLASCSASRENAEENERWTISGRYCEDTNGKSLLLSEKEGAICITPADTENLFDDLENGDEIEISVDGVAETYPAQATVYSYNLIEKGTVEDLDAEEIQALEALGWKFSFEVEIIDESSEATEDVKANWNVFAYNNREKVKDDNNVNAVMPSIVFLCVNTNEDGDVSLTFWDKNGEYYSCADNDITTSPFDELIEKFNLGEGNFIKQEQTCDIEQLQNNYETILEIADNADYKMVYPDVLPDVEARSVDWYGLYYNNEGKICYLLIHSEERMTQIYANDERANDIYRWYMDSISLN